ncbi:B-cell antigen receptor complex-associated protein beta chain-like [Thamnophis elegans]|uniref:B-cell antigen receptor complex-associated protein beta chain-like n=1 Tax=Thamnophis elegans TaxID=35005 RepID=UPI0013768912|nr:B-cell antigen receptor complex-associated protein beta chain-like [Thamnophis elegans]
MLQRSWYKSGKTLPAVSADSVTSCLCTPITGMAILLQRMTIVKASGERNNISQKQDATTFMNVINTRFIAARGGSRITLSCYFGTQASWHKETDQGKHQEIMNSSRVHVTRNTSIVVMRINKLQNNDNGIYHFKSKNSLKATCGTELKVMGISTYEQVQSRHNVKDAIILIQTILLVLFVSIPVLLTQGKVSEWNSHNRSGLMVELADTYEDIGVYQDRPEKWDFGEHLCEEQKG